MSLIQNAKNFAIIAHAGQYRKYTGENFVTHPIAVAENLSKYIDDEEMIAAAYLHDVVEDTHYDYVDLLANGFTVRTVDLVRQLTKVSSKNSGLSRAERKAQDRAFLSTASDDAKTIKFFDIMHNAPSIIEHDKSFAPTFMSEFTVLIEVLKTDSNAQFYEMAKSIADEYYA